jgi:hypothetical protein
MKPLSSISLTFLLVVTAATAQQSATGGSVAGTVLCEDTQGPARHANVFLQAPISNKPGAFMPQGEAFGATTDLDGSFTISNVTPGEYYVITWYPGYISAKEYIFPGALSIEVSGGREPLPSFVPRVTIASGKTERVEIHVKRGGSISGSVSYSDGAPIPNVALTPKSKLSDGKFADSGTGAFHTDSAGHYRIDGLADGSYVVLAGIEGAMVPVFGGDLAGGGGLMIFAGGGMRPSKARVIDVSAPKDYAGVNITIPLTGVHEISGAVAASDGHRLNHGVVRLYPTGEPRFSLAAPLKGDGTFSFHRIPADSYTILVEDASDWKLTPKGDGGQRYEERTLVQRYGPASVDVNVADTDLTNVFLTASPIR